MAYTDGMPSPPLFRKWAGIAAIAGALERRVWTLSAHKRIYPNLYTLLVAPPGVGKEIIQEIKELWHDARKFKVAPDSVSKASLIDALREALTIIPKSLDEYHSLLVASNEFGVLVPAYDLDFLSVLNRVYDNPSTHSEKRRSVNKGEDLIITNPQLNIIAGTQPGYLSSLLPAEAWSMGTTSRLIMIYHSEPTRVDLFPEADVISSRKALRTPVVKGLASLFNFGGEFQWAEPARAALLAWYNAGMPPVPSHSKLTYYNSRRILHIIKLSMVAAASRSVDFMNGLELLLEDFQTAQDWLLEAEVYMPDIFRAMSQKSDYDVMREAHVFIRQQYNTSKKALHATMIQHFLAQKVPSEKVLRVMDLMEKSSMIVRMAGTDLYTPKHENSWGVE